MYENIEEKTVDATTAIAAAAVAIAIAAAIVDNETNTSAHTHTFIRKYDSGKINRNKMKWK